MQNDQFFVNMELKAWSTLLLFLHLGICSDPGSVHHESYTLEGGSNLTLPCKEADLEERSLHTILWFCRGCEGVEGGLKEKARFDADGYYLDSGDSRLARVEGNYSLVLSKLTPGDTGDWFCTVNGRSQYLHKHSILVRDVPSTPGRPLIMAFSSRTVNLSWAPPLDSHNSPVLGYLIKQRMGEDSSWEYSKEIRTGSNSTEFSVRGLQPFTVYSFKVVALNEVGYSEASVESYYMITLRETPTGKPTITEARNQSSSSIHLAWHPPHPDTLHGEFLGYKLSIRIRAEGSIPQIIMLKEPGVREYTVQGLQTFSQYLVSLQVINPEGEGPKSTVVVMTDEGIPSAPENVEMKNITSESVLVSWSSPKQPNGIILGYRLYYMHTNYTDVQTIRESTERSSFNLTGLGSYTEYRIWLKAFTWRNEGYSSSQFPVRTDLRSPPSPQISNLTCLLDSSVYLEWRGEEKTKVDMYSVYYKEEGDTEFMEILVENATNLEYKVTLENLTEDASYWIKLRGFSRSIVNPALVYEGDWSEIRNLVLKGGCQVAKAYTVIDSQSMALHLNAGVIAGLGVTVLLVAGALLSLAFWRRYWSESYYYLEETSSNKYPTPDWDVKSAVPAHLFVQYVQKLRSSGFSQEFESLNLENTNLVKQADISSRPGNRTRNRYNNVLAYDSSLVQLKPLPGEKDSSYINANYVDGFQRSRAYIATQGPLENSVPEFWRMVWEQRVETIIMITNLVEQGKDKCACYWPTTKSVVKNYGIISVSLLSEKVLANYTIRIFSVSNTKLKQRSGLATREIRQYHYTSWPDHGAPDYPLPILSFIKTSSGREGPGPTVVHCSAGVGRTGAYIVIDSILKQLKAKGELSIDPFLRHIRKQRNFLVQTLEQFVFIHEALVEIVLSGETSIKLSYISRYINSLQSSFTTDETTVPFQLLERQFSHVTSFKPTEQQFSAAILPYNQLKNQSFDFIPLDGNRVVLSQMPGVDGSDYINASWMPGYTSLNEFILTQHPKEQTTEDFWRLVWEQRVLTVVCLSCVQDPDFPVFWPHEQKRVGNIIVSPTEEGLLCGFQTKDFSLRLHNETQNMKVRLIFCPEWSSENHSTMLSLAGVLNSIPSPPILVMDTLGGFQAGTLIALSYLTRQAKVEGCVDVYQTAKTLHYSRPGIWVSNETLLGLYKATQTYCLELENKGKPDGTQDKSKSKF